MANAHERERHSNLFGKRKKQGMDAAPFIATKAFSADTLRVGGANTAPPQERDTTVFHPGNADDFKEKPLDVLRNIERAGRRLVKSAEEGIEWLGGKMWEGGKCAVRGLGEKIRSVDPVGGIAMLGAVALSFWPFILAGAGIAEFSLGVDLGLAGAFEATKDVIGWYINHAMPLIGEEATAFSLFIAATAIGGGGGGLMVKSALKWAPKLQKRATTGKWE